VNAGSRVVFGALLAVSVSLMPLAADEPSWLVFFYAEGCSICARAKPFLERLEAAYPELRIERYEISRDRANVTLMIEAVDRLQVPRPSLPMFILGQRYWVGFSDQLAAEIEQAIRPAECSEPWPLLAPQQRRRLSSTVTMLLQRLRMPAV
jgi:hypothetical protein